MSSESTKYIVYMLFGEKEFPVECSDLYPDKFREEMIRLQDVKGLSDNAFPNIKINHLCIPKSMILYYFVGEEISENLEDEDNGKEAAVSKAYDSQGDIFTR